MKKSKVLVPALGILCLTAAASVTGTLAWFTASQTVSVDAGNFVAINPSTGLEVKVTSDKNTTCPNDQSVNVSQNLKFRDASVNIGGSSSYTATVYKAVMGDAGLGSEPTSYAAVDPDTTSYKFNTTVIYAATWDVQFKATSEDTTINYDLYFDGANSEFGDTTTFGKCFRIGMFTGTTSLVWAPGRTKDEILQHVKGLTTADVTTGTAGYKNVENYSIPGVSTLKATAQAQANYMGSIAGQGTKTFKFIAWYEGCDEVCISGAEIKSAASAATMKFSIVSQFDGYKPA